MTAGAAGPPRPVVPARRNTDQQRSNSAARPGNPRLFKIDVSRQVEELEHVLRAGADLTRCMKALEVLERWQFDEMLDDASRKKARRLVREFTAERPDGVWRR